MELTPRNATCFNQHWEFQLDDGSQNNDQWQPVTLPHDWSIESPFSQEFDGATAYLPGGIGWYRKQFANPIVNKQQRCFILFDGIYNNATLWLNDQQIHFQAYGYAPFYIELTNLLQQDNVLTVKVDRSRYVDSRWYTGSGIYRDVTLITTHSVHIPIWGNRLEAKVSDSLDGIVRQTLTIESQGQGHVLSIVSQLIDSATGQCVSQAETQAESSGPVTCELQLPVAQPKLWCPDSPNLYHVETQVFLDSQLVDHVTDTTGFRLVKFCPSSGVKLNHKPIKIKGVCLHHDGGIVGAAVPDEIWTRRLKKLKQCGVNAIRIAHNPASKAFLHLCDRLGLLVQDEFFDEWDYPKDKRLNMSEQHSDYISRGYSEVFQDNYARDLSNTLLAHINHPCIFMWSIGNEIEWTYPRNIEATGFFDASWDGNYFWSLPPNSPEKIIEQLETLPRDEMDIGRTANKLSSLVKSLDSSRPVTANCILPSVSYHSGYADALDVIGFSYRRVVYDYGHELRPNLPIIGNENLPQWHEWKAVLERDHVAGIFLWTGINYMGESHGKWPVHTTDSGLLDSAGFTGPSYALFRSLWNPSPYVEGFTVLASESKLELDKPRYGAFEADPEQWQTKLWQWDKREQHWNYADGEWVVVEAYSNCPSVALWLNDQLIGVKALEDQADRTFRWALPSTCGQLKLVGLIDDKPAAVHEITTTGDACSIQVIDESPAETDLYRQLSVTLVDSASKPIRHQETTFSFDAPEGGWVGSDNGSHQSLTPRNSKVLETYHGRALIVVKRMPGKEVALTITSSCGLTCKYMI